MSRSTQDDLLDHYQAELEYLRRGGAEFARLYPKVANRLQLGAEECPDPDVERLLEGFAFLTARIQRNLSAQGSEVATTLLDLLYPHFLAPVPSMSIARLEVDPEQGTITGGHEIPKHTPLFAETADGQTCRFRTCYPVTLWPVRVAHAGLEATDRHDFLDGQPNVATVLRLRLEAMDDRFEEMQLDSLRFYLNADMHTAIGLYELLAGHSGRACLLPEGETRPVWLPKNSVRPVGLGADDAVLPHPPFAHAGYRLIQEYFTFPRKFLFFDVEGLRGRATGGAMDLLILLHRAPEEQPMIGRDTFALGCTPIINLFPKTTEPIRLDHRAPEYRLVGDMRRERSTEIHTIERVSASADRNNQAQVLEPFFSYTHEMEKRQQRAFWHARRVPTGRSDLPGTDILLSFFDLDLQPTLPATRTVFAHALCTNRRLAEQLPAGAVMVTEAVAPLARVTVLHNPTPQLDPPSSGQAAWRLVSHLSLNHLSFGEGPDAVRALREVLRLYGSYDEASAQHQIAGIREMSVRRTVRQMGEDAWRGFVRGHEIDLTIDESAFVGTSPLLLTAVLSSFFALYTSVNSFAQLVVRSQQREGIWMKWPARAGEQN
ncbi:MAG TPA: type VI secretion system baseplate subunit TssF, partial [Longimicrobiaceae bacterium]|nr:type VI secretion system baseplate subunit TssF [Longimicrobiaceae bacterium]